MRSLPVAPFLRDRLEVRLRTRRPWVAAQPFTRLAGPALLDAFRNSAALARACRPQPGQALRWRHPKLRWRYPDPMGRRPGSRCRPRRSAVSRDPRSAMNGVLPDVSAGLLLSAGHPRRSLPSPRPVWAPALTPFGARRAACPKRTGPAGAMTLLDTDPRPAWLQALGESTVPRRIHHRSGRRLPQSGEEGLIHAPCGMLRRGQSCCTPNCTESTFAPTSTR